MKLKTLVLLVAALALLLVAAPAGAKKKPFKPSLGSYSGTVTTSSGTTPVTAKVVKEGGKIIVGFVGLTGTLTCTDQNVYPAVIAFQPQIKGKSFSETGTGTSVSGRTTTTKLSGSFQTATSFSGTAIQEAGGSKTVANDTSTCTTGTISFKLKKK